MCTLFCSQVHPDFTNVTLHPNHTYCINCERHLLTSYLIPDVLLLVAYVYSLYVFRMALPEHLTTLMETVSFVLLCVCVCVCVCV